jgi:hypothetical protein
LLKDGKGKGFPSGKYTTAKKKSRDDFGKSEDSE